MGVAGRLREPGTLTEKQAERRHNRPSDVVLFVKKVKRRKRRGTTQARTLNDLTPRQQQICAGIIAGLTTKGIAYQLGIAVSTVETHREVLYRRIGAHCAADVVRWAYAN